MRTIHVDGTQRELRAHGTARFPLEINHDDLRDFQDIQIRCHWHEELEASMVLRGTARYTLGAGAYTLPPGQGILINSRVPHTVTPWAGTEVRLLTVILHPSFVAGSPGDAIDSQLMTPFLQTRALAAVPLDRTVQSLFFQVDEAAARRPFAWELRCRELLCGAFFRIFSQHQGELSRRGAAAAADLRRLETLLELLHSRFDRPLDLGELSADVGLSRESCCRFFKRMTGQTISQYLETYRVFQGARLLREGRCGVMEAALQVGFSNAGRFAAAFSRRMGCSPRQFARSAVQDDFTHSLPGGKA